MLGLTLAACSDGGHETSSTPVGNAGMPATTGAGGVTGAVTAPAGTAGTMIVGSGAGGGGAGAVTAAMPDPAGTAAGMSGDAAGMSGGTSGEPTSAGAGGANEAGAGGAPASSCTGKRGAPGLHAREITGRNVLVYVPPTVNPNTGVPLVFVHHGWSMDGEAMRSLTGFQAIADREGFAVAFPDGVDTTWNVGTGACGAGALGSGAADDFAFVKAIISSVEADQCIAREHVFMTGFSMGGYFSNHAGCQLSDVIHGIAPHSGGAYPGSCPGGPIPVMIWHGTADAVVEPSCGPDARDIWVARNGCQPTFDTVAVEGGTCEWHHGCPPGAQVVLCMMNDMNHQWSGGEGLIGATGYENASEMIWAFFKKQSGL